jgi:hypothetical protein
MRTPIAAVCPRTPTLTISGIESDYDGEIVSFGGRDDAACRSRHHLHVAELDAG